MSSYFALAAWAFAAGALIPVMGTLNAGLARSLGSAPVAAVVLFAIALAGTTLVCLLARQSLPDAAAFAAPPRTVYLGGLIVAFYVVSVTLLIPMFGVGNTIMFAMTAQIVLSAVMDQIGLFGAPLRPVSVIRLIGIALMLAGLFLTQFSQSTSR